MGKMKKKNLAKIKRHEALDQQILGSKYAKPSTRVKVRHRQEEDEFVDSKLTEKILIQARQQQEDLEEEVGLKVPISTAHVSSLLDGCDISAKLQEESESSKNSSNHNDDEEMEEIEINPEDEKAFEAFMPNNPEKRAILADIIKDKLTEKQTEMSTIFGDTISMNKETNERLISMYKKCAHLLAQYRSGPLPKPFKVIPKFANWEQLLYLTQPDKWSAMAMYQATRIFSSNLSVKMAQRFYNLILLPRLRDDIAEFKKLNFHLYQALKKSLFKPAAFFKGIMIPLCESGTCTLREATIFGSVLAKCSVPILDSGAALMVISRLDYNGANSIFMRVLLEKKYALPFKVIDAVVSHFMKFENDERNLPLLWHQCLLTFIQIYKNDLSTDQQTDLLRLIKKQSHAHISPEIRKELLSMNTTRTTETVQE